MSEQFAGEKGTYESSNTLGDPGLYGQAYLCWDTVNKREVVVKVLHAKAPADGHEAMEREARVLDKVATSEKAANVQYAVRLLDKGVDENGRLRFIVLERATGQNVQDDLIDPVVDWQRRSLDDEQTVLDIAYHFCYALVCVHQSGLTYDDMKLQNLFWKAGRLRIIDWNVAREIAGRKDAVAGDWARFGARLYELYTGQRIGISREGFVVGTGPSGLRWDALPTGVRAVISKALDLGYKEDSQILSDLAREREQLGLERAGDWNGLIGKAEAVGDKADSVDILAPLFRAERLTNRLPENQRDAALERCAPLREVGESRLGRAPERSIALGFDFLTKGEGDPPSAKRTFDDAYTKAGKRDPRPRRGLWLAQIAIDYRDPYRATRINLERMVADLNAERPDLASDRIDLLKHDLAEVPQYRWLVIETEIRTAVASDKLAVAVQRSREPDAQELINAKAWPDLREYVEDLTRRHEMNEKRRASAATDSSAREAADLALAKARRAERRKDLTSAIEHYREALRALHELSTPDEEYTHWLTFHIRQLIGQENMRELETEAGSLDPSNETILAKFVSRTCAALPILKPVFHAIEARGQHKAEAKLENLEGTLKEIKAELTAQMEQIKGQRREMNLLAKISELNELINAGVLTKAREMLASLQVLIDTREPELIAERSQNVNQLKEVFAGSDALITAKKQIDRQEESAKTQIGEYRQALVEQDWKVIAAAFTATIKQESDNLDYYAELDKLYPILVTHISTTPRLPLKKLSNMLPTPNNTPGRSLPSLPILFAIADQTSSFYQMIVELVNGLKVLPENTLFPKEIGEIARKHLDRLKRIGYLLRYLEKYNKSNDGVEKKTQLDNVLNQLKDLRDVLNLEDTRNLDMLNQLLRSAVR